jgi:hypothetical protein
MEQFIHLQSLTLLQIDDRYLNQFLNYIISSSLKSLAISVQTLQVRKNVTSPLLLSSAIAHHTLQHLYLNIGLNDWNDIQWPMNRTLRSLRIVTSITLKHFRLILGQSPNLQTLVLKEVNTDDNEDTVSFRPFQQLTSLTFDDGRIEINKLEQCLSLTPALTYLKLIGTGTLFNSPFNGFQWEKLMQTKLRSLKKFEFSFCLLTYSNYHSVHIENLINSFRTSFWLNDIHCFIACDYIAYSRKIMLYTLPICTTQFVYHTDPKKISLSNFTTRINDTDMDNVQQLDLQMTKDLRILSPEQVIFY